MKGLNLSKFHKISEDKNTATMQHEDGHKLIIAKHSLPAIQRKQLERLPTNMMAQGGSIEDATDSYADKSDVKQITSTGSIQSSEPYNVNYDPKKDSIQGYDDGGMAINVNAAPTGLIPNPNAGQAAIDATNAPQTMSDEQKFLATIPNIPGIDKAALAQQYEGQQPDASGSDSDRSPAGGGEIQTNQHGNAAPNPMMAKIKGYGEEKAANIEMAKAASAQGQQESNAISDIQDQISNLPTQSDVLKKYQSSNDTLMNAYKNQTINPDQYWQNHSKVAAGIGMLISGLGGAGPNSAMAVVNNGINREIDAQKSNQSQSFNLWKMNREALGDDLSANLATQNQMYTGLKYKLDQASANAMGPQALARAHLANAQIDQQIQANNFKLSLMNPTSDNPDPSSRVQFLVPPEKQAKVFDEIGAAQDTVKNTPGIMEAFDQASKEVRPMSGGLFGTSLTAFVPGMKSPGQSALQARMGPTFKDVEGTVRQAAMDNMERNVTPHFGDSDETIATKRQSLIDYLTSKSAAPTAKGFGIDLTRFPSTNTDVIRRLGGVGGPPQQLPTKGGVKYQRQIINGKAYMVPVE